MKISINTRWIYQLLFTLLLVVSSSYGWLSSSSSSASSNRFLNRLSIQQQTIGRNEFFHERIKSVLFASAKPPIDLPNEVDVIIIGSGLAGLSCGSLLSHCNKNVIVLESHDVPGGCCHTWERRGFHFESGPSLYSGFSTSTSPNPLKNIFQIINEDCEWITYDRWGTVLPDGQKFAVKLGPEEFVNVLQQHGGPNAQVEFDSLMTRMKPLSDAAQALSSMALREDIGVVRTLLLKYPREVLQTFAQGKQLTTPFADILKEINVTDAFVKNWLDMLCFLLQGLPASGTLNTVMAYMLADWYRPGVVLDFPKGGSGSIVNALIRGIEKGGTSTASGKSTNKVYMNCHVSKVLVSNNKASGVQLQDGRIIYAREAVVSNADPYITNTFFHDARTNGELSESFINHMNKLTNNNDSNTATTRNSTSSNDLKSFIHLHVGIDGSGLPTVASEDFPTQWAVIRNWDGPNGVEDPRNIVLVSMPSLIDPTMAPPGKHVIHAYTPATEPYEWWEGMDRQSEEYKKKKEEAADFLWKAIEEYIPNARDRVVPGTFQLGTPLTHERFLRRTRGSYGPRVDVSKGQTLPGHKTPLKNFYLCGDYTFPSIGVPATAASGAITANTIVSVSQHLQMLQKIKIPSQSV